MTPAQIAAALRLSLAWRRRLAEQEGPGRWCSPHGRAFIVSATAFDGIADVQRELRDGYAWLPASPLAWLDATGLEWEIVRGPRGLLTKIYVPSTGAPDDGGDIVRRADPIDCALAYMETYPCSS